MDFLEYTFLVAHGDGSFTDSCVSAEHQFDCLFDRVGLLQDFVLARLAGWLLFFRTVTH
jgi:hypothetical protein